MFYEKRLEDAEYFFYTSRNFMVSDCHQIVFLHVR